MSTDVTGTNPLDAVDRPGVDRDSSPTVGLTGAQAAAFMRAARAATGPTARRDAALLALLAELGLRVGEALQLDLTDLRPESRPPHGARHRQGRPAPRTAGPPPLSRDLDRHLENP